MPPKKIPTKAAIQKLHRQWRKSVMATNKQIQKIVKQRDVLVNGAYEVRHHKLTKSERTKLRKIREVGRKRSDEIWRKLMVLERRRERLLMKQ